MNRKKDIVDTIKNFGIHTSIAGLNNAFHRKSLGKKLYWTLIFVGFLAATLHGVTRNLSDYFAFDIITSTDLERKISVIFPAVSICNQNK